MCSSSWEKALFSPDGQRAVFYDSSRFEVWDLIQGTRIGTSADGVTLRNPTLSPDGKFLAASASLQARLWDLSESPREINLTGIERSVFVVALDGGRIITLSSRKEPVIWEP